MSGRSPTDGLWQWSLSPGPSTSSSLGSFLSAETRFGSSYVIKKIPQAKLPYLSKHKMEIPMHLVYELLTLRPNR